MLHASMDLKYMCGAVVVSKICVHQHTWVCRHQHHTGARRRQIRLERIRHIWSKTMGRKYHCSWIKQSRSIENWFVRLRPQKSSKFWKLETRLGTPQKSGDFKGRYHVSSFDCNFTNLGVEWASVPTGNYRIKEMLLWLLLKSPAK